MGLPTVMESTRPHDLPRLLHADDRWLRDLSRRLLRDTSLAEDAVQETWLSVLRSPPSRTNSREDGNPVSRGFLATALRNVISKMRRGESRRRARETAYASRANPSAPSPLRGVIEQLELRRVILDAVLEMPPPYRDVLLRRFYEDHSVAAIAQDESVPVATVKTRLRRAEEMLAAKLDAQANQDRGTYLPALIAIARPTLGPALLSTLAGVVTMAMKQKVVFVVVALLVGAAGYVLFDSMGRSGGAAHESTAARAPDAILEPPTVGGSAPQLPPAERAAVPTGERVAEAPKPSASVATKRLEGQVFDVQGKPFPRAQLAFQQTNVHDAPPVKFESDAAGRFAAEIPKSAAGVVDGIDPAFSTLYQGVVQVAPQQIAPAVVLAPRIQLAGNVVDHDGEAIGGASLQVEIPRTFRDSIPVPTENTRQSWISATAGKDGRFALVSVPLVAGSRMIVEATGYPTLVTEAPGASDGTLRYVLERPAAGDKDRVRGQVVDDFGVPVEGARVMLGMAFDRSDERGFFDLDKKQAYKAGAIRAIREGSTPAEMKWPLDPPSDFVTLKLGPPSVSIRGIVRYADGTPANEVSVQTAELDVLGFFEGQMLSAEEFSGGYRHSVETDASGSFELRGLSRKSYVLRIVSTTRGFAYRTPPIVADGPITTIDLPKDLGFDKVRGRIVDRHGDAIANALVGIEVTFWRASYLGSVNASNNVIGTVHSGADGRFVLTDVPRLEARISASSESILPIAIPIPSDAGEREIEIVAERRCHFLLELPANDPATYFTAQDEQGKTLDLTIEQSGETKISSSQTLTAGRSGVVIVSDRATTFVLYKDQKELRRISVALKPGETTTVRG